MQEASARVQRFEKNVHRIRGLVSIAQNAAIFDQTNLEAPRSDDVLRAAVVFLHASFEEMLRTTERVYWLNVYPQRSKLLRHPFNSWLKKGRNGNRPDISEDNVDKELELRTYCHKENYLGENSKLILGLIGILAEFEQDGFRFEKLDMLSDRRNRIVHRTDWVPLSSKGQPSLEPISVEEVEDWLNAAMNFSRLLAVSMVMRGINE